jgi:Lon protease-like protein
MPSFLPLFPLDLVLFPETPLPLHIFEPRYKEMITECVRDGKPFGVVRLKVGGNRMGRETHAQFGCSAEIIDVLRRYPDGRMDIIVIGRQLFEVLSTNEDRSFLQAEVRLIEDDPDEESTAELRSTAVELHSEVLGLISSEITKFDSRAKCLSFHLMSTLPVDLDFKQQFLEMTSERERLTTLIDYYSKIMPRLKTLAFGHVRSGGWVN